MTIQIKLRDIDFQNKGKAKIYFKEMLNKYNNGDEINKEDSLILCQLLERHPENEKIGIGIKRFYKDIAKGYTTSCFHVERIDDSTTDFSYDCCINGKEPNLMTKFNKACKEEIKWSYKDKKDDVDIKFTEIIKLFIEENNIKLSEDLIVPNSDMQYATKLSSKDMGKKFIQFYKEKMNIT